MILNAAAVNKPSVGIIRLISFFSFITKSIIIIIVTIAIHSRSKRGKFARNFCFCAAEVDP